MDKRYGRGRKWRFEAREEERKWRGREKRRKRGREGKQNLKLFLYPAIRLFTEEIYITLGIRSNAKNAALVQPSWSGL